MEQKGPVLERSPASDRLPAADACSVTEEEKGGGPSFEPRLYALRFAVIYAVLGSVWIAVSDQVLKRLFTDPAAVTIAQTVKGFAYIGVTTLLVYFLARQAVHKVQADLLKERLRSTTSVLDTILASMGDAVIVFDPITCSIQSSNEAAGRLFGFDTAELTGHSAELLHANNQSFEQFGRLFRAVLEHSEVFHGEWDLKRKDGSTVTTEITISRMHAGADWRNGVIGIFRDITERKAAEQRKHALLQRITSLNRIDQMFTSMVPLDMALRQVVREAVETIGVDAAAILRVQEPHQQLLCCAQVGFASVHAHEMDLRMDDGYVSRCVMDRQTVAFPDVQAVEVQFVREAMVRAEGFHGYACCPIVAKGRVLGLLEVYRREAVAPDADHLDFLGTLAGQAALGIENISSFEKLQVAKEQLHVAYDSCIEGWARALDYRDHETVGHSRRVTEITVMLAQRMGLGEPLLTQVRWGALLHDIGKMGVPDRILLKPDRLDSGEWEIIKRHPGLARDLLSPIAFLAQSLDIPYCHHERWDGTGYPRGLKGEDIPLTARIFAVADIWDALCSDRPYRQAWPPQKVLEYLQEIAGSHLDPHIVAEFLACVHELPACSPTSFARA